MPSVTILVGAERSGIDLSKWQHALKSATRYDAMEVRIVGDQDLICNYVGVESMIQAMHWNGEMGLGVGLPLSLVNRR